MDKRIIKKCVVTNNTISYMDKRVIKEIFVKSVIVHI